ncbi:MAG: peptidase C15 [Pseudomonadota bacterium]
MTGRVLVTGFGPFPGVPDNPAAALVRALEARDLAGVEPVVLPTRWDICETVAVRAARADAVVMFGVAAREWRIRYERVALPVASKVPDAVGCTAEAPPLSSRRTAFDTPALVRAARRAGFDVRLSNSPGTYICNASYAAALSSNPKSLFVHIPPPVARSRTAATRLEAHALWLIGLIQLILPASRTPPHR